MSGTRTTKKLAGGVIAPSLLVLAWTALLPASGAAQHKPGASHPRKAAPLPIVDGRRSP